MPKQRWGAPYLLVHRADLQRALLEAVAQDRIDHTRAGDRAHRLRHHKKRRGRVDVGMVATGTLSAAIVSIGADGLRSFVRQQLGSLRHRSRRQAGRHARQGEICRLAQRSIDAAHVPAALRRKESTLWLGPGAHLVHYPLRGGSVINVVAVVDDQLAIDWDADILVAARRTRRDQRTLLELA